MIATKTVSARIQDIPLLDFYIINKNNPLQKRMFQDLVIKNIKFTSYNFEQGIDTPGRFFVLEFIATELQGVHLKDYFKEQVLGEKIGFETANEINLIDFEYEKLVIENLKKYEEEKLQESKNEIITDFISLCNKWCDYTYLGSEIRAVNVREIKRIYSIPLDNSITDKIKNKADYAEIEGWLLDLKNTRIKVDSVYEKISDNYIPEAQLDLKELYKEISPQLETLIIKANAILKLYNELNGEEYVPVEPTEKPNDTTPSEDKIESIQKGYKDPKVLSISDSGVQFIVSEEGFKPAPYPDPPGQTDLWAIGYGNQTYENGKKVKPSDPPIDKVRGKEIMHHHIKHSVERELKNTINCKLSQSKFDALCSYAYNMGPWSKSPKLVGYLNRGQYSKAAEELLTATGAGGQTSQVLVDRRKREYKIFIRE